MFQRRESILHTKKSSRLTKMTTVEALSQAAGLVVSLAVRTRDFSPIIDRRFGSAPQPQCFLPDRKRCHLSVTPLILMMSSTGAQDEAKPHLVLLHDRLSVAKHAMSHLKKDEFLKGLGLPYAADEEHIVISTRARTTKFDAATMNPDIPYGMVLSLTRYLSGGAGLERKALLEALGNSVIENLKG